jgi:hypothetical protein
MTKIIVFQPFLNWFTILESLEKFIFNKLIVSSINRFSWFLLGKVVNPNLKIQFFYCSILLVQTMCYKNLKLDFTVDQPQLIPKVEL